MEEEVATQPDGVDKAFDQQGMEEGGTAEQEDEVGGILPGGEAPEGETLAGESADEAPEGETLAGGEADGAPGGETLAGGGVDGEGETLDGGERAAPRDGGQVYGSPEGEALAIACPITPEGGDWTPFSDTHTGGGGDWTPGEETLLSTGADGASEGETPALAAPSPAAAGDVLAGETSAVAAGQGQPAAPGSGVRAGGRGAGGRAPAAAKRRKPVFNVPVALVKGAKRFCHNEKCSKGKTTAKPIPTNFRGAKRFCHNAKCGKYGLSVLSVEKPHACLEPQCGASLMGVVVCWANSFPADVCVCVPGWDDGPSGASLGRGASRDGPFPLGRQLSHSPPRGNARVGARTSAKGVAGGPG
ncbi:hypothetical protein T484DRAFT_1875806 [Baffinella frigidus]|nr:hypothetical protein T484DRAFT_1875806 [Cryptophyta sp. CCMP2293]